MTDTPTPTRDPALDRHDPTSASTFAGPYTSTQTEDSQRTKAINDELDRRAAKRLTPPRFR